MSHHSLTQIHFLSSSSMGLIERAAKEEEAAKEDEKGDAGDSVVIWVGECFFRSARQVLVAPLLLCPMKSACTRKNANVPQETHASLSIYWVR